MRHHQDFTSKSSIRGKIPFSSCLSWLVSVATYSNTDYVRHIPKATATTVKRYARGLNVRGLQADLRLLNKLTRNLNITSHVSFGQG